MGQVLVLENIVHRLQATLDQVVGILDRERNRFRDACSEEVYEAQIVFPTKVVPKESFNHFVCSEEDQTVESCTVEGSTKPFAKTVDALFLIDLIYEGARADVFTRAGLRANVDRVEEMKETFDGQVGEASSDCESHNLVTAVFGLVKEGRAAGNHARVQGYAPPVKVTEVPRLYQPFSHPILFGYLFYDL